MKIKKRLDVLLVEQGHADNRTKAQAIIMSGLVYVNGQKADKPGVSYEETVEIEVRGETTEINRYMIENAERILKLSAEMYGCTCDIKLMGAAEGMVSDVPLATRVHAVCAEKMGMAVPENPIRKAGGSEDVSYMMNRVQEQGGQATFMRLMTPMSGPAHDRTYDFGEEVLVNSIKAFCGVTADLLAK